MNADQKLKVAFLCGDRSGLYFHDIFLPTIYFHKYNLLECQSVFTPDFPTLLRADLIILQRQYAPESGIMLRQLKDKGKVCVFIIDDNIWKLPPGNPAIQEYSKPGVMARYEANVSACHAFTTSTPYLKSLGLKLNPKGYIFRNLVEKTIADFKSPGRDNPDEIRIGWAGTIHHHGDIIIIEPALERIMRKYHNVKFVFMGYRTPRFANLPYSRFEYYDFVHIDSYYACLGNLDIDIGLVPLVDNPFNWGKTCRKFQEYSILSIPTIASSVGEYAKLPSDVVIRTRANNRDGWYETLSHAIENINETRKVGEKAYQYIRDEHDIEKFIFERAAVYYKVYNDVTGEGIEPPEMVKPFIDNLYDGTPP